MYYRWPHSNNCKRRDFNRSNNSKFRLRYPSCWNATSPLSFKALIKQTCTKVPEYFHSGNRYMSVLHARLRSCCSGLNCDLYECNIVSSPMCACGKDHESASHYLLYCEKYEIERQIMLNSLVNIPELSIVTLLHGNVNLSYNENKLFFLTVQQFISNSKRFKI